MPSPPGRRVSAAGLRVLPLLLADRHVAGRAATVGAEFALEAPRLPHPPTPAGCRTPHVKDSGPGVVAGHDPQPVQPVVAAGLLRPADRRPPGTLSDPCRFTPHRAG